MVPDNKEPDFSGYASKNGLKCSDGRTILSGAFKHMDKRKVPLVWQHQHDEPINILGHAILENRADGVYTYGYFNDSETAQIAKNLVKHGDVTALSIYANQLVQDKRKNVLHGEINEVSLVLAGANPGAYIDNISLQHGDSTEIIEDEAIIYTGLTLEHENNQGDTMANEEDEKTLEDVYDSLDEDQKKLLHFVVGEALEGKSGAVKHSADDDDDEEEEDDDEDEVIEHSKKGTDMARNVFEQNGSNAQKGATLTHAQLETIVKDAESLGSFKESFLKHAVEYGIEDIDLLFPDAKAIDNAPELIARRMEWVNTVINGARKSPFSRIKSLSADITHEEARAKGYIKGTLKKDEFFKLEKRVTTPTTIYKKQKLDRDDIIDITDLDVVAWLKGEMRLMLEEEIARAVLIGDGREIDDPDKIDEDMIRPIAHDHEFYSHKVTIPANVVGDSLVEAILRARPVYRGKGNPTMYCTEDLLTDLILIKDKMGRRLYPTMEDLKTALRVKDIQTVEVMESLSVEGGEVLAILVNMADYTIGADQGGKVSMFDDFDIDYNQYKYLIEGRMSGALTKFKTALVFTRGAGTLVVPTAPTILDNVITIPTVTGVVYSIDGETVSSTVEITADVEVVATAASGYYFAHNTDTDWDFAFDPEVE